MAYLGHQGRFDPGVFQLPIVVDSAFLSSGSGACGGTSLCSLGSTPNPCDPGDPLSSCLRLSIAAGGEGDACYTLFDDSGLPIDLSALSALLDSGNTGQILAGAEVLLQDVPDGGADLGLLQQLGGILDPLANLLGVLFQVAPGVDGLVVKLPVIAYQGTDQCGGELTPIIGAACFELRQVLADVSEIHGRFLCPDSPIAAIRDLFQTSCAAAPGMEPGGSFGLRASRPVLVQ